MVVRRPVIRRLVGVALLAALSGVACSPPGKSGNPDASILTKETMGLGDAGGRAMAFTLTDAGAPSFAAPPLAAVDAAGRADETIPPSSSEELTGRARHLLEAIAQENALLAADIVFPRDAWSLTRDAQDSAKSWEKNVNAPFSRQLKLARRRVKGIDKAQFVSLELGHSIVQAVPRKKEWRKPLWKVRHSRLTFTVEGRTQRIEIAEMVGWRGSWYVTKLR